jgi:hypothetical protein
MARAYPPNELKIGKFAIQNELVPGLPGSQRIRGDLNMKTVQLAIGDLEYAQSLRNSLLRDGIHRVYLVAEPDLRIDGVIVIDGSKLERLSQSGERPERFVVITQKGNDSLSRLWNAGIRHVVFAGDSPNTAQLAIIAAELRLPNPGPKTSRVSGPPHEKHHASPRPKLPVLDSPAPRGRCRLTIAPRYIFPGF